MKISQIPKELLVKENKELMNRVLFDNIADDGESGDLILVFGSVNATKYRVPLAVELYKAKRAGKILMSGGSLEGKESIIMKENAVELGVPADDIFVETVSTNTMSNVRESRLLLENRMGLSRISRILVVSSFYHMRRCFLTLKTFLPEHIEYSLCPALDHSTRPDNWWQSESGTNRVLKEVEGLIYYTSNGRIIDWEI
jgi:hypothetical protein